MTTNVPPIQFTPTGLVIPTEAEVLAGVQADYNSAFGGNLNPAPNTPQGQLESSTSAVIADANAIFAEFVNQVDPDTASGFMQDAIARIYFINRLPGLPTAVVLTCTGLFGTIIPVGALAQDTSGNIYVCQETGTIPVGGSIDLPFANQALGPIPAPANTVNIIYQAITGWDTVNNASDGVEGSDVESRASFEYRRKQTVALNSHGSIEAIGAEVFEVPGVIDVFAYENFTNSTVNVGSTSYPVVAHSIYVAVVGGAAQDIGQAIFRKKNDGSNMNGNTSVTIVDESYLPPQPTYTYKYNIPSALPIFFHVQIQNSASLPSDIVNLTKDAIVAAFNGTDGSQRVRIGSLILASKFYAPVSLIGPEVSILSILIGVSGPGALTFVQSGIDQQPTIDPANITVTLV